MVFWLCRHGEHSLCVCRGQGHNPAAEPQGVQPSLMLFAKILVPCHSCLHATAGQHYCLICVLFGACVPSHTVGMAKYVECTRGM